MQGERVSELFKQLPGLLGLDDGQARVTARFTEGKLVLRVRVAQFRIPAKDIPLIDTAVRHEVTAQAKEALEELATLLHRSDGQTEIIAEYQNRRLRSIDHVVEMKLELPVGV